MDNSIDKPEKKSLAGKLLGYTVRWLLPLALTVLLVTYMFRKVDFADMWRIVTHGVDYWWILAAMGISVFSHIFRAMRWGLQLRALGIRPPFMALCCSIFGTYALNLVFPRLGEVWRCTYIANLEKKPFTKVMGSMVGDRIYTDIEMAHNANAFGVLVLSGETTLEVADAAPKQPHLICDSIEVLGELIAEAHK